MILNNEQDSAYKSIMEFLKSSNSIFLLTGAAGTGKTSIISTIFKNNFVDKKIVLSATTNKAVSVIEQMFANKQENIDILTIHKICSIKRSITDNGTELFSFDNTNKSKNKSIFNYDIIVIDEASMISLDIIKYLYNLKTQIRGKIILVGDMYQLPPINEIESQCFNKNYFDNIFKLTQTVRFNSNILDFSLRIRDCINKKKQISLKNIVGDNFKIYKNEKEWLDMFVNNITIKNTFLTYTNKRCKEINNYIRKKYFKNKSILEYMKNEVIVFNNYYKNKDNIKFYTSNTGLINNCVNTYYTINRFPLKSLFNLKLDIKKGATLHKKEVNDGECPICFTELKENENVIETNCKHNFCQECIEIWMKENNTCPFCRMIIDNEKIIVIKEPILTEKLNCIIKLSENKPFKIWNMVVKTETSCGLVKVIKKEELDQFNMLKDTIKKNILELKNYIYLNKKFHLKFILKRLWDYYYIEFIDEFADISYGYCITVHKSQGSTFNMVFIDSKNILKFNRRNFINYKCLYTAITRASTQICMLI